MQLGHWMLSFAGIYLKPSNHGCSRGHDSPLTQPSPNFGPRRSVGERLKGSTRHRAGVLGARSWHSRFWELRCVPDFRDFLQLLIWSCRAWRTSSCLLLVTSNPSWPLLSVIVKCLMCTFACCSIFFKLFC